MPDGYGQSIEQFEALTVNLTTVPGDQRLYPMMIGNVQTMYDQSIGQFGALPSSTYAQGNMLRTASPSHYAYPEFQSSTGAVAIPHVAGNQ